MSLHDVIRQDGYLVFGNFMDFAEPVTYLKRTGKARAIHAVVDREQLATLPEDGDVVLPSWTVYVANSEVHGIASDELDLGGDMLLFSPRVGQEPERRSILRLVQHDEGMLTLICR